MRGVMMAIGAMMLAASGAQAKVSILVDKDAQQMVVSQDGVQKYVWPVSTGNPSHETPNGSFQTFRMEENHFSKEFDDAPMPHAIFFTKSGHAIHGTDTVSRLGSPASHGCVRLSRANAQALWDLVKTDGLLTTSVTLTGSSQVALARNPRPANRNVARRDVTPDDAALDDGTGTPTALAPLPEGRTIAPQRAAPRYADSYADGYAPQRSYRGSYDAQGNPSQGYAPPRYYVDRGYQRPQVYAPQGYYGPRGYNYYYGED